MTTTTSTTEERAARILHDLKGYHWHSGGGTFCARVDLTDAEDAPYVLVTDAHLTVGREPGEYYVGFYHGEEDEEGTAQAVVRLDNDLRGLVKILREELGFGHTIHGLHVEEGEVKGTPMTGVIVTIRMPREDREIAQWWHINPDGTVEYEGDQ